MLPWTVFYQNSFFRQNPTICRLQIPNFTKWTTKMIFFLNLVSSSNFLLRIFVKKLLNLNFLWKFGYSFNSYDTKFLYHDTCIMEIEFYKLRLYTAPTHSQKSTRMEKYIFLSTDAVRLEASTGTKN